MKINIQKEGTTLRAHVELPVINPDIPYNSENREIWMPGAEVLVAIQEEVGSKDGWLCTDSPDALHNLNERTRTGTWVFEKHQKTTKVTQKTNSDTPAAKSTKTKPRSFKK
jgi:uncharacterized protein CbrC (UPF0167 family)